MQIYQKQAKSIPGWGYWGDNGEIEVGISAGYVENKDDFQPDKPHYHKQGTVYILTLEGTGIVQVEGQRVEHSANTVLKIDPGETYHHVVAKETPLSWITFCTIKDPGDKVVV